MADSASGDNEEDDDPEDFIGELLREGALFGGALRARRSRAVTLRQDRRQDSDAATAASNLVGGEVELSKMQTNMYTSSPKIAWRPPEPQRSPRIL